MLTSYNDDILELLGNVPMVTKQQIKQFMTERHGHEINENIILRSLNFLSTNRLLWKEVYRKGETGEEYAVVSKSKLLTKSTEAKYFPYAFWLYLASDAIDAPCTLADPPFIASFTRHTADSNDLVAQVAVLDCEGKTSALSLAVQTSSYNDKIIRQWLEPQDEDATELPKIFWRALVLVNMPDGFLESKEFRQLQGVGYSRFFAANAYEDIPRLVAKVNDADAWKLTIENSTKDM